MSQVSASCPTCDAPMVLRTARRGRNAGGKFWGCTKFPGCRGTRDVGDHPGEVIDVTKPPTQDGGDHPGNVPEAVDLM